MSNNLRGELVLVLGSKEILLKPSFNALVEIENLTGKSVVDLVRNFEKDPFKIEEMVVIIRAGAKAANQLIPDNKTLGEMVLDEGIIKVMEKIFKFLCLGLGVSIN